MSKYTSECPFCETVTGHLNNHVRMSEGDGHAEQGEYPDDWDKESPESYGDEQDGDGDEIPDEGEPLNIEPAGGGDESEIEIEEADIDPEGAEAAETLEFGDSMADRREYECGNCGEPIPYLGGEEHPDGGMACPKCGDRLFWSVMQ